jgi:predicted ATP-grasp superfamily ATP-dependent carboligase
MEISKKDKFIKPRGAVVFATSYTALAIVRSLGRHGIPVWILDDGQSPTRFSRYVLRCFPLPVENETEQIKFLLEIAQKYDLRGWTLFPDGDKGATLIANYYSELGEYYRLTTPPWDVLQWAVDKRLTYQLAAEAGVAYPKTFYPKSRADVEELAGQFPMIMKPAHHLGHDAFSSGRGWRAKDRGELLSLYDELNGLADPSVMMIQEMILNGADTQFSYAALCKDGNVFADTIVERKRLNSPEFGVGVYMETIEKPEIEAPAKRWLEKNNYTGLVEIDFIFDRRDGLYKILDVNTRAWGWIAMCADAGVDFPFLMWKLANGEPISPVRGHAGIRWVRTLMDFEASVRAILAGSLSLSKYLASLKGVRHETFVRDDIKPALMEVRQFANRAFRKLGKVVSGRAADASLP